MTRQQSTSVRWWQPSMSVLQFLALQQQSRSWRLVSRTLTSGWAPADNGLIKWRHKSWLAPTINYDRSMVVLSQSCRRTSMSWSPLMTLVSLLTMRCHCPSVSMHCVCRSTTSFNNFARLHGAYNHWNCETISSSIYLMLPGLLQFAATWCVRRSNAKSLVSAECCSTPHHRSKALWPRHVRVASVALAFCLATSDLQTCVLVHHLLSGHAPAYLADDIQLLSEGDRRPLHSSASRTFVVPRAQNSYDDRSFFATGLRVCHLSCGNQTLVTVISAAS